MQRRAPGGNKNLGGASRGISEFEFRISDCRRKIRNPNSEIRNAFLGGFGLSANLLLNFPVREGIFMTASRAIPGAFYRVSSSLMKHLDDQVAMQTHRRMA